jgi:fumarate hydratase subunit alpha
MREIHSDIITEAVKNLCIEANLFLSDDVVDLFYEGKNKEQSEVGLAVFDAMLSNLDAAKELTVPVCQDTGMAVVFAEVGQDVHIVGELLCDAINEGVRQGYVQGKLRCSVVDDPLNRINTEDNTPAIIHTSIVQGDKIHITVSPKGFGSENMSKIRMFTPAASREDIIKYIVGVVEEAGSNPCPPVVVGVGIGGDFEYSAILAKKALCRSLKTRNANEYYAKMEADCLDAINRLGIGPQGFGGTVTALAVNIEQYPTHIAGLPVAVNMGCHITRHRDVLL